MGTFTHFSPDLKGRPVLRLDPQAAHKAHLDADGRCSLHVQLELPGQQRPHCTLKGRVVKAADYDSHEKLATVWERRFGADGAVAAAAAALGEDDGLCWMEVTHVFTTLDVGEEEIAISGSEYEAAEADPLRECAAKIVEDMNRDYWEDIRRFSETYGGIDDEVPTRYTPTLDSTDSNVPSEDEQGHGALVLPTSSEVDCGAEEES